MVQRAQVHQEVVERLKVRRVPHIPRIPLHRYDPRDAGLHPGAPPRDSGGVWSGRHAGILTRSGAIAAAKTAHATAKTQTTMRYEISFTCPPPEDTHGNRSGL